MSQTINIPGLFKTVADRVNNALDFDVFFAHGVYDSVKKELIQKDGSITMKGQKYPLIWLVTPVLQDHLPLSDAAAILPDVQVFILMGTDADWTEDENIEKCFAPYLRPIYDRFLMEIERSGLFQVLSADAIPHEMKEWTYQKTTDGKVNLFNDYISAIQIRRMRLLVNEPVDVSAPLNP